MPVLRTAHFQCSDRGPRSHLRTLAHPPSDRNRPYWPSSAYETQQPTRRYTQVDPSSVTVGRTPGKVGGRHNFGCTQLHTASLECYGDCPRSRGPTSQSLFLVQTNVLMMLRRRPLVHYGLRLVLCGWWLALRQISAHTGYSRPSRLSVVLGEEIYE